MRQRVVVTGLGLVSSLGNTPDAYWRNLMVGKSGISPVSSFDTSAFRYHLGGEVKDFEPEALFTRAEVKVFGRASQFAIYSAHQALNDAKLLDDLEKLGEEIGAIFGTTFGEAQIIEKATDLLEHDPGQPFCSNLKQYNPNSLSVNVAKKFGLCGPNMVVPTACSAGNYAIAFGTLLIRTGRAKLIIAGGSDPFSHVSFSGFSRLGVMTDEKCQPFDKNRKGMLVGEGSACLVLEEYEHAKTRGAKIYSDVLGFGLSCDANHMTAPEIGGVVRVMEKALDDAKLEAKDVDYISAHGTGTKINDYVESNAIRSVFYDKGNKVPVSSIKSMLGHTMGAASILEAIVCILAIREGKIPPTVNFVTPDPDCDIDCVPNEPRKLNVDVAMNNSLAFGGNNACVVFGKV